MPALSTNNQSRTPEFLRVVRAHRVLIALVAIVCGATALGVSLAQQDRYSAQAALRVSDPTQGASVFGTAGLSAQTPAELAAAHVPQVTRPGVAQAVKADLRSPMTPAELAAAVSVSVDPSSNLVLISATAPRASDAAAIANAFASEDARQSTRGSRRAFASQASRLEAKIRSLDQASRLPYVDQLSQLQSLSTLAQPVQVTSTAAVPGAPSSPKPARNAIVGLIIGVIFGVLLAYARQAFDRRLHDPEEIEEQFMLPLLGYVRSEALGRASISTNGHAPADRLDLEAFRILRQNVEFLQPDEAGRCVAVTSAMAEEGKSTVAAGLALASASVGKRTLLLECDLHKPVLAERLGLPVGPGLTEYLSGSASPQEILQIVKRDALAEVSSGHSNNGGEQSSAGVDLVCITAGAIPPHPASLLVSSRFEELLRELPAAYDLVIIDCPPLLPVVDTLGFVPYVSAVLICARCDQTTRDHARAARTALERVPPKPSGAVVTGVSRGADYGYGGYEYA